MYRLRPGLSGRLDYGRDVEVALLRRWRPYEDGLISQLNMQSIGIRL